jgi:hypothetical protein
MAEKKVTSHAAYLPYEDLHKPAGSYEGGQCMVRCEYVYTENHSCSYRWQALKWIEAGGADRHIYEEHPAGLMGTAWRTVSLGYANDLSRNLALVTPPENIRKNTKDKPIASVHGRPFRTAFAPYGNNPHHLLPDATLKDGILQVTKPAPQIKDMIVQGLLKEQFDLNLYENVMILPTADEDGGYMGLPSHPNNHNDMDKVILRKVLKVLKPYDAVVDKAREKKKHGTPSSKRIKARLIKIGKTIHAKIVSRGQRAAIKTAHANKEDIQVNTLAAKVGTWLGV